MRIWAYNSNRVRSVLQAGRQASWPPPYHSQSRCLRRSPHSPQLDAIREGLGVFLDAKLRAALRRCCTPAEPHVEVPVFTVPLPLHGFSKAGSPGGRCAAKATVSHFQAEQAEFQLMLCGVDEISVDDWEESSEYTGYTAASEQVRWFWAAVRDFSAEERGKPAR